jgi:integration host factor subunit beta
LIKSDLVARLFARHRQLDRHSVEQAVDVVLEAIAGALATGRRVELRGFGSFAVKKRPARLGRNPRTGEQISVPPKRLPFFRSGKSMRHRLGDEIRP